ncbi:MAG: glycosyltransferase family 4 protein [Candidatus Eiseniibacteriota bacterium]
MRVLHMTHQGDEGGSTNSITWLSRGLAERGHEVWLACRPESLIARRFASGPVRVVPARLPRGAGLLAESVRWRGWMARHAIDVVNAQASLDRHLASYMRLLGTRAAVVHTRRNVVLSSGGWLRARFDAATTDAVIAVSQRVADDLRRRGLPSGRVHVIRNGLPLGELEAADPARVQALRRDLALRAGVPVVGVVARRKSQGDLIRAARSLGRPIELLLVGVEEDAELLALAAGAAPEVRTLCLGFRADVVPLSALFDVFVLPSEIEGFSLALLEAMARGLPCIATDAGGNAEALAEGCGWLVPPGDVDALAKALARALADPDAARALGARARERVFAHFDVSATVSRTEELYETLRRGSRS